MVKVIIQLICRLTYWLIGFMTNFLNGWFVYLLVNCPTLLFFTFLTLMHVVFIRRSTHSELTLNSFWTHFEVTLNSISTHSQLFLNSLSTHSQLTLNSLWTHSELTLNSLWTHSELTLNSLWTHSLGCSSTHTVSCWPPHTCIGRALHEAAWCWTRWRYPQ